MTQTPRPLEGIQVLVTRPAHQAERLCRLIEAQGGSPFRYPVLEILEPHDPTAATALIDRLADYHLAIFTSANAVARTMPLILARQGLPSSFIIAAIGRASSRELERFGVTPPLVPDTGFNSEALLAMPRLRAVAGQRIVIFRGEGGRELLGDTLKARGAQVDYAEVYRRGKPEGDPRTLIQPLERREIQVAIVTSNEILQNLFDIVGVVGQQWLRAVTLVTVSERTQQLARKLGVSQPPLLAKEASDEAIVETLLRWAQARIE